MKRYYWVGSRQSDVENEDVFCGSITKYGTKTRTNISFLKSRDTYSEKEYLDFLINSIRKIISKDNNAKFIFANSLNAYNLPDDIFTYCECLNSFSKLTALNNKFFVRQFLSDACKTPPFLITNGEIAKDKVFVKNVFNDKNKQYVIQEAIGGGGKKTYFLTNTKSLVNNKEYIITPYLKGSIPLNVHCVIFSDDILILPPSIQLIVDNFKYVGSDFNISQILTFENKNKLFNYCHSICKKLQNINILGVIGLDFLFYKNDLLFLEANFRFQGSSPILNMGLKKYNISLYSLFIDSFKTSNCNVDKKIFFEDINLSFLKLMSKTEINISITPIKITYDGFKNHNTDKNFYMYNQIYDSSLFRILSRNK